MPDVSNHFITWFSRRVWHFYQNQGSLLRPFVDNNPRIEGKTAIFHRMSPGRATQKSRHGKVVPMGIDFTQIPLLIEDWYGGDWCDELDLDGLNYNQKDELAKAAAMALGRKTDEQIIDAAVGGAASIHGDGSTTLTEGLILQTQQAMRDDKVPADGQWVAVIGPREFNALLQIPSFANSDYVGDADLPWMQMGVQRPRRWNRAVWIEHDELKVDGGGFRQNLMWTAPAMGHAANREITPDITWHGDYAAWFINAFMAMNAVIKQAEGARVMLTNPAAPYS